MLLTVQSDGIPAGEQEQQTPVMKDACVDKGTPEVACLSVLESTVVQ